MSRRPVNLFYGRCHVQGQAVLPACPFSEVSPDDRTDCGARNPAGQPGTHQSRVHPERRSDSGRPTCNIWHSYPVCPSGFDALVCDDEVRMPSAGASITHTILSRSDDSGINRRKELWYQN
ncbi:hypothetical protein Memar_0923 [Methanoculleus marisnigri JR1]|uniref:Uncharacterized protein n=1 Tax=Methanoculleus marisnigri (strain ATCC 35101 / DSM 1498 / JR1) TaxID=368407 RepID=A3CU06_METMJ|nr:hypothetical protein Memar_0923 [Methanoculleus marisnigri JR1]